LTTNYGDKFDYSLKATYQEYGNMSYGIKASMYAGHWKRGASSWDPFRWLLIYIIDGNENIIDSLQGYLE